MSRVATAEQLRRVDNYNRLSWRAKGLYTLAVLSLVLAACKPTETASRAPGVTEALPTPAAEVMPVPVEVPPTAIDLIATSTEVLTGGGGGEFPLCSRLAPFIPGRIVDAQEWRQWVDPDGNPVAVAPLLETMRGLDGTEKLNVWVVGGGETFRWGVEGKDRAGNLLWAGTANDSYLDRPDRILVDEDDRPIVELNPLPDPEVGGKIIIGVSGDRVTAKVVAAETEGRDLCFDAAVNAWVAAEAGGPAAAETPRPEETLIPATKTPTPALSTPRPDADPQEPLLTELASDRATPEPKTAIPPTETLAPPTAAPTAVILPPSPILEAPPPVEVQPPSGGNDEIPGQGLCLRVDIPPGFNDFAHWDDYNFPTYMGDFDTSRGNADTCDTPVRHPEWEKPGLLVQVFGPQGGFPEIIPVEEFDARNYGNRIYPVYGYIFDKGERNHANTFSVSLKP